MTVKTRVKTIRRLYSKPQLEQVQLLPEEAVLAHCKGVSLEGRNLPSGCGQGGKQCKDTFGS
jgi:hypothetical protein